MWSSSADAELDGSESTVNKHGPAVRCAGRDYETMHGNASVLGHLESKCACPLKSVLTGGTRKKVCD